MYFFHVPYCSIDQTTPEYCTVYIFPYITMHNCGFELYYKL